MALKTVQVVAALITNQDKVFATQRGYGEFKDGWEFPGGKIEPRETPEQALKREIQEELATEIQVEKPLTTVEYDYPTFHLSMECFICKVEKGNLILLEHEAKKWLSFDELDAVDWLPADQLVVTAFRKYMCKRGAEK
jgi:8-oxo-dGTP diphosphatase